MIVFGIGAHLFAIGGVENSVRSMLLTLAPNEKAIVVCHQAAPGEKLPFVIPLGGNVDIIEYVSVTLSNRPLESIYRAIAADYPDAMVICRHHLHVLAAKSAGLYTSYMVPSIISQQVARELVGPWSLANLRLWAFGKLHKMYQQRAMAITDKNFAFSESMRSQMVCESSSGLMLADIELVKPGIDAQRFYALSASQKLVLRDQLILPRDKTLLLFVGRVVRAKGLDVAIKALVHLPDDYELVLVGAGDYRAQLETMASALNVSSRIHWQGAQSNVDEYYRCADMFIMTSYYEPLGQTILEAAASGLPIVAFKKSAQVDTATEELGLDESVALVELPEAQQLADAILKQTLSDERSIEISRDAHERFNWRVLLDALLA